MNKKKVSMPVVVLIVLVTLGVVLSLAANKQTNESNEKYSSNSSSTQQPKHSKEWYTARKAFVTFYNDPRGGTGSIVTNMDDGKDVTYTVMKHNSDSPYVFNTGGPSFYVIRATDSDGYYEYKCVRLDGGGTTTGQIALENYFTLHDGSFSTEISPDDSAKSLDKKFMTSTSTDNDE